MTGIGFDFGNSNSSLALYDGKKVHYLELDERGSIAPSALYLNREMEVSTGSTALRSYLTDNTSRKIEFKRTSLGNIQVTMAEMDRDYYVERDRTYITEISANIDSNLPGRLFCSIKSYLGNRHHDRFSVFEKRFTSRALTTLLLRGFLGPQENLDRTSMTIGRPVHFSGDSDQASEIAVERLSQSLLSLGVQQPSFLEEPVAAAYSYYRLHRPSANETVLIFDFGGGTLDLSLLELGPDVRRVRATGGVPRAGDEVDRSILRSVVFPALGKGAYHSHRTDAGSQRTPFPFSEYAPYLQNWQSSYLLYQPRYREPLLDAIRTSEGEDRRALQRLDRLVRRNGSFELLKGIEQAKIALTDQEKTRIKMPEIDLDLPLTRSQLARAVTPLLTEIEEEIKRVLAREGIGNDQVDRVICTGGSSRLAQVDVLLDRLFPGKREAFDPFRSIAAGLAIADYERRLRV